MVRENGDRDGEAHAGPVTELGSEVIVTLAFLVGLYLAYFFFLRHRRYADSLASNALGKALHRLWSADWGMDWLYDHLFVRPLVWFARVDKDDFVDSFYDGTARLSQLGYHALSATETGQLRWYAAAIAAGSVLFVAIALFL